MLMSASKTGAYFLSLRFVILVAYCFRDCSRPIDQQGIPAVLLGVVAILFLPNRPEKTSFFTEEERKIALARANRDSSADTGYHVNKSKSFTSFLLSCSCLRRPHN